MKFYHVNNCNRAILLEGLLIPFAPYELSGTWLGVHATDNPAEIAVLEPAARNPKSPVTAISEPEYANCIRIKKLAAGGYAPSLAVTTPTPGEPNLGLAPNLIETNPALAVIEPPPEPLASVAAAVEVVAVQRKTKGVTADKV